VISKIGITIFGGPRQILEKTTQKLLNISMVIPILPILSTRVSKYIYFIGIMSEIFKSFLTLFFRI